MEDDQLSRAERLFDKVCESVMNKPLKTFAVVVLSLIIVFVVSYVVGWANKLGGSSPYSEESYISTQTVYMNTAFTPFNYLNIDDKAWLVPLMYETVTKAMEFGDAKGKNDTMYMGRVVVTALDPSTREVELKSGISSGAHYEPEDLYIFYLPDGQDIADEKYREHVIEIGDFKYKVTLLRIDTKNATEENQKLSKYAYTFRVKKMLD